MAARLVEFEVAVAQAILPGFVQRSERRSDQAERAVGDVRTGVRVVDRAARLLAEQFVERRHHVGRGVEQRAVEVEQNRAEPVHRGR